MKRERKPTGEDLLTARDIQDYLGISAATAESLMRNRVENGLTETIPGFRRDFVRRKHIEPQSSGGTND